MTKFFDWCDKHQKRLSVCFILVLALVLFTPLDGGDNKYYPEFFWVFYLAKNTYKFVDAYSVAPCYALRVWCNILSTLLWCIMFVCLIASTILVLRNKKPRLIAFFSTCLLHFIIFAIKPNLLSATDNAPLFEFTLAPHFYVYVALFALYVLYLLLRRFYAPAKARVVASAERRKASRKPTKDERIAELEKRVAELESKDKD